MGKPRRPRGFELLRTERLAALVEVVRHEGFSRAARALGRTQSSLSQLVAALEEDVGAALLVREGRRTRPTEAGRVLVAHAERVLAELARARAELDALGDLTRGRLVVGTTDTLSMHVLPRALAELRRRHPGIELVLDLRPSPEVARRVAEGAVDLGVLTLPLPAGLRVGGRSAEAELRVEPLADLDDAVVCPRTHPLVRGARSGRVTAAQLAKEPLLLLDRRAASRAALDAFLEARGVVPRVAMEMASVEVLLRLVELGFGVTVVPAIAAKDRALAALPVAGLPGRRVGLVTGTVGPLSPAARAFAEIVRAKVAQ